MLKLFLWLRYLRKKRIVLLSIAAITLSVTLLIVVASLFTGFIQTFENAAVEAIGDVVIDPPTRFPKYQQLIERLEQTEIVDSATAVINSYGLLLLGQGNVRAVEIWGIEPERRAKVTGFDRFLIKDSKLKTQSSKLKDEGRPVIGYVGIGVLSEPDKKTDQYDYKAVGQMLGKDVILTTGTVVKDAAGAKDTAEFQRKVITFTVADVVETGVYQFDKSCVYLPIEQLQKTLYPDEKAPVAGQIHIKLRADARADVALAVITGVWQNFVREQLQADTYLLNLTSIDTARHLQSRYIAAYKKQLGVLMLIFGVVSFGVVLLIFCIFYLIVRLRRKDIAIIKSCGAASASVAFIFVGFGLCVGIIGSGLGVVLGFIITSNINTVEQWIRIIFGLKLWKSSVYMFSRIPSEVDWVSAEYIVLLAIIAAAAGTLLPAIVAARTKPVEILRYE
jgi:lipoprotein-releasing system permease protein